MTKSSPKTVNIHEAKTHLSRLVDVPHDFDSLGQDEIETIFGTGE